MLKLKLKQPLAPLLGAAVAAAAIVLAPMQGAGAADSAGVTKTLPKDGTIVMWTMAVQGNAILDNISVSNYPTKADCTFTANDPLDQNPDDCNDSEHQFAGMSIDGKFWRPGDWPQCLACSDVLGIRNIFSNWAMGPSVVPLQAGQMVKMFFAAEPGSANDVTIEVVVGTTGGPVALF